MASTKQKLTIAAALVLLFAGGGTTAWILGHSKAPSQPREKPPTLANADTTPPAIAISATNEAPMSVDVIVHDTVVETDQDPSLVEAGTGKKVVVLRRSASSDGNATYSAVPVDGANIEIKKTNRTRARARSLELSRAGAPPPPPSPAPTPVPPPAPR